MMSVPVEVKRSEIHGLGIFALTNLPKGTVLWMFTPGMDRKMSDYAVKYAEPRVRDFIWQRGYINPDRPFEWVICTDEAQFWNFPPNDEPANCTLGEEQDGEKIVIAAREISEGEELTIVPESDFDYERKLEER